MRPEVDPELPNYHQLGMDELPLDPRPRKTPYPGVSDARRAADKRYDRLRQQCTPSGVIYLVRFADGILKVGSSVNAELRLQAHRRKTKAAIAESWVSPIHLHYQTNEKAMIAALVRIGRQHLGREWFTGVPFEVATELASELSFPGRIEIPQSLSGPTFMPHPPLLSASLRLDVFGYDGEVPQWDELTVYERVGFMARAGLGVDSIALREGLPVEVVPGLIWYFEKNPDVRWDWERTRLLSRYLTEQINRYCGRWEPYVKQESARLQKQVARHAAEILDRMTKAEHAA